MNYLQSAQALYEQMVRDRRHLHQHPEVGMDLPETCAYVMARLTGTVKVLFQPGEEVLSGARSEIEAGILEDPHVDAAMGAHMIPMIPAGLGGYGTGVVSASSDHLVIRVEGRGGHGAHPQSTVDPINIRGRAQVTDLCSTCSLQIDGDTAAAVAQGWQREGLKMLQRGEKMSGSEDFAEIAARVPSTFFVVGGGTAQDGCGVSLHNPKIRFREEALIYGAAAYASGAAMWLELH